MHSSLVLINSMSDPVYGNDVITRFVRQIYEANNNSGVL